jgi:DUF1680 family protein
MEARRVYANTNVRDDAGCVALTRGPVVYCFEEKDNGPRLSALCLPDTGKLTAKRETVEGIGETVVLEAEGIRLQSESALYSEAPPIKKAVTVKAMPYYTWGNRGEGEMRVWIMAR